MKELSGIGFNMVLRKWLDRFGIFSMIKFGGNVVVKKIFERFMFLDYIFRKWNVVEEVESKFSSLFLWWYRLCGFFLVFVVSGLIIVFLFDI